MIVTGYFNDSFSCVQSLIFFFLNNRVTSWHSAVDFENCHVL